MLADMKPVAPILLLAALSACATTASAPAEDWPPRTTLLKIGQARNVDGPRIEVLRLLEDSRCPMNARCVQAGTVRIHVQFSSGPAARDAELELGRPISIADGSLELVEVRPQLMAGENVDPADYEFALRFMGGL